MYTYLLALPGSGKTETRVAIEGESSLNETFMKNNVQVDDYPYVSFMRSVSDLLTKDGTTESFGFFRDGKLPFATPYEWGTLSRLVDQDLLDITSTAEVEMTADSPVKWLFERIDQSRSKVATYDGSGEEGHLNSVFSRLSAAEYTMLMKDNEIQKKANDILTKLNQSKGKYAKIKRDGGDANFIIEFARGAAEGITEIPFPKPYGYGYAFSQLDAKRLENARILYIYVTPEQSREKNIKRGDPSKDGVGGAADESLHQQGSSFGDVL